MTLRITEGARAHLAGRPLVLRASPRNGCCGGSAAVPVAESGPPLPLDTAGYAVRHVDGVEVHVEQGLDGVDTWTVDVDGLWRWRRLRVDGAELLPVHGD